MNKLPKLLALNKGVKRDFRAAMTDGRAEIFIYDMIGEDFWTGGGVTAMMFVEALSKFRGAETIHLHINSPGGDVFEARAITAAMLAFPGKFVAHIDGLAASAASYIAARCDEVEIAPGAFIMIHNGWTIAAGDRHAMNECAGLLEKIDASICADYVVKTGLEPAELSAMMDAETWLDADKAIEMKFADRLAEKTQAVGNTWNLSAYSQAPEIAPPAESEPPENTESETETVTPNAKDKRSRALRLAEISA
jgi:ATP-dependent Clp protease protease subunit